LKILFFRKRTLIWGVSLLIAVIVLLVLVRAAGGAA